VYLTDEDIYRLAYVQQEWAGAMARKNMSASPARWVALALMDHPNIAKVLDGGLTDDRRPYFVMELVNGLTLTRYCDELKLTPRERLELFVPICQAVQHAHQKGKRLVTASRGNEDTKAKVWDASTGLELLALTGHTEQVRCAVFSPDDKRIVTGS